MLPDIALVLTVGICAFTDLHKRKIYNLMVFPSLITAILWYLLQDPSLIKTPLVGVFVGATLLMLPFMAGAIGAGDVKLLAVVGAWQGPLFAFQVLLVATIAGGLWALGILWREKRLLSGCKAIANTFLGLVFLQHGLSKLPRLGTSVLPKQTVPYGVAIAAGVLVCLGWR
ncbi:MAG: A24 family peptidase [Bacillota bacterium]